MMERSFSATHTDFTLKNLGYVSNLGASQIRIANYFFVQDAGGSYNLSTFVARSNDCQTLISVPESRPPPAASPRNFRRVWLPKMSHFSPIIYGVQFRYFSHESSVHSRLFTSSSRTFTRRHSRVNVSQYTFVARVRT